jgi:hypothetical protein
MSDRKGGFLVSLSRDEVSWGVTRRRGALFSGSAPAFDMFVLRYESRRIGFTSFHSRLRRGRDDYWGGQVDDEDVRRYISAHRFEVLVADGLTFAISEAVVYGGEHRAFEPVYMNPLLVFYSEQWNSEYDDNILIAGDFSVLFPQHAEIRGEMMIDDFQYDFGNEPHEFGFGLRVTAVNPLYPSASVLGASYYQVRNQTYGHFVPWNRFIHEGQVMGYPDGPDGDRFELLSTLVAPEAVTWTIDYTFRRQGEGRATDVQEELGSRVDFPSGTVQTIHRMRLGFDWRPCYSWLLSGRVAYHDIKNKDNQIGMQDSGFDWTLSATFNWKQPHGFAR